MTIKKLFALILAVLMLCSLAACSEEPAVSGDDHSDWVWVRDYITYGALSDTGYYYAHGSILHYFDFVANASTVLCYNAGCLHEDNQCDAYMFAMGNRPMYFFDDRLYYFSQTEPTLYSRNATGIDLKKIGTMGAKYIEEQKAVTIGNCAVAGGYLYYEAAIFAQVIENGVSTTKVERECIGRINLASGKDEIIIEEMHDKQNEKLILCAARENGVLLNRWEGMEEMDRNDPAFSESLGKIPVTLEQWNGETGETTVLFRKTMNECSGIKMVSGGKVYYKSLSGSEADGGFTYSYDLRTGKEETACPHRTRWHLGGAYVQCNDLEGNVFLYDMSAGKTLPYELNRAANVYNVSDKGYVMQLTVETEEGGPSERRFYYVTLDSLADGLQEADLQYMYTF